jgi:GNAT superfamily N-acetyltransferase
LTGVVAVEPSARSYALLADGTTMTIRPAGPGDYEAVKRLHETMSPGNLYFRFFSASRVSPEREARRISLKDRQGLVALLGLLGDELAGVARYELTPDGTAAVPALAVADDMHRRGVATLLLEHLVSLARACGVKVFVAEVLPDSHPVLHLLADSGLAVRRRPGPGAVELSMPVPRNAALGEASAYLDAVAGRDKHADVASLEPLLNPRSVAVVGVGPRAGSAGRPILLNIRAAGFAGALYAVGPRAGPGRSRRHHGRGARRRGGAHHASVGHGRGRDAPLAAVLPAAHRVPPVPAAGRSGLRRAAAPGQRHGRGRPRDR